MLDNGPAGRVTGLTWDGAEPAPVPAPALWQWPVAFLRAVTLIVATYALSAVLQVLKWVERGEHGGRWYGLVRVWGRLNLLLCGLTLRRSGAPDPAAQAIVANHAGWLDIFTLLAADRVFFVSKAEVRAWPVVGPLSRQMDPVYIDRRRQAAKAHGEEIARRLADGDRLCLFPEGTSTDGRRVLPFRSTLFAVFTPEMRVQPVSIVYRPRPGLPESFYGWWGNMALGPHLKAVFALSSGGVVDVVFHPSLLAAEYPSRKALARAAEERVRDGLDARVGSEV
ncbi:MAG: lysophospholipid acyltransferase family protein [Pseudomonadota bacterium]